MQSELPSNETMVQPSIAKRVRLVADSPSDEASDKAIPPTSGKTPLEAAMAAATTYTATLHQKLQPFLNDLIRCILKDASAFHYKSEKLQEMRANPENVPAICRTVGMKLQAVSEVTKSAGYKTLEDELVGKIEALQRNWAMRYVLPMQDLNVRAMRKRFQLSYCRLLSSAAKGFIAQVGAEGYNASIAIMDLLAMHGNDVAAPLNVTPHDFVVLFKEAAGLTTIPTPTVDHSMIELINKINGTPPLGARGQEDGSLTTTAAANAAVAAAATAAVKRLTAAESAVAEATTQNDLIHTIAKQAQIIVKEAAQQCAQAHKGLAEAHRARTAAIDPVSIATATEAVEVMEVTANKMERNATTKGNIAYGASILAERACNNYYAAINALNSLPARKSDGGGSTTSDGASIGTQGTTTTPRLTSTLSMTPTSATATVTPGTIIPGNPYV
jgi:hypothetical protein